MSQLSVCIVTAIFLHFVAESQCSLDNDILGQLKITNSHRIIQSALDTAVKSSTLGHIAIKRQINNPQNVLQNIAYCTNLTVQHVCSSGSAREKVEIALTCRSETQARLTAQGCAKNENGEYCAVASLSLISNTTQLINGIGACSDNSNCSIQCRNFLTSLKNTIGCCINSVLNTTNNPYSQALDFFSYSTWQQCSITAPSSCTNGIPLPQTPSNAQRCSRQQLARNLAVYECNTSIAQPLADTLLRDSRCSALGQAVTSQCGVNSNGQYCSELFSNEDIYTTGTASSPLNFAASTCQSDGTACSSNCKQNLQTISTQYGCCIDAYNQTTRGLGFSLSSLSYELWNACGVDPPGACTGQDTTSGAGQPKAIAWLIAAITLVVALL